MTDQELNGVLDTVDEVRGTPGRWRKEYAEGLARATADWHSSLTSRGLDVPKTPITQEIRGPQEDALSTFPTKDRGEVSSQMNADGLYNDMTYGSKVRRTYQKNGGGHKAGDEVWFDKSADGTLTERKEGPATSDGWASALYQQEMARMKQEETLEERKYQFERQAQEKQKRMKAAPKKIIANAMQQAYRAIQDGAGDIKTSKAGKQYRIYKVSDNTITNANNDLMNMGVKNSVTGVYCSVQVNNKGEPIGEPRFDIIRRKDGNITKDGKGALVLDTRTLTEAQDLMVRGLVDSGTIATKDGENALDIARERAVNAFGGANPSGWKVGQVDLATKASEANTALTNAKANAENAEAKLKTAQAENPEKFTKLTGAGYDHEAVQRLKNEGALAVQEAKNKGAAETTTIKTGSAEKIAAGKNDTMLKISDGKNEMQLTVAQMKNALGQMGLEVKERIADKGNETKKEIAAGHDQTQLSIADLGAELKRQGYEVDEKKLAEAIRHNKATEAGATARMEETVRHNKATEAKENNNNLTFDQRKELKQMGIDSRNTSEVRKYLADRLKVLEKDEPVESMRDTPETMKAKMDEWQKQKDALQAQIDGLNGGGNGGAKPAATQTQGGETPKPGTIVGKMTGDGVHGKKGVEYEVYIGEDGKKHARPISK